MCSSSTPRTRMRLARFAPLVALALMTACGEDHEKTLEGTAPNDLKQLGLAVHNDAGQTGGQAEAPARADAGEAAKAGPSATRKIIYRATVALLIDDFAAAERELLRLAEAQGGYLARAEVSGSPGAPRVGTWTFRVPVDRFGAFLASVRKLGDVQRIEEDAQDVTEEYVDLEARIRNKQVEERRLRDHLEKSTGKLEDILAVERELSRVREEVERQQGRLQLLASLASLTTVTVSLSERTGYKPPEAPTLATSLARTFLGSLDALAAFGKALLLIVVALAPWLPILALALVPIWLVARRRRPLLPASPRTG